MTWNEIRLATLQKMFSSEGAAINEHDETVREYLNAMPQAAREGADMLLAAGFGMRRTVILLEDGGTRADLQSELPRLYAGDPLELYRLGPDGSLKPLAGAHLAAGRYLQVAGGGPVAAVYTPRPEPFGPAMPGDAAIQLREEGAALLPLYMASQLYKDDDVTVSTQYRNEFEAALDRLRPGPAHPLGEAFCGVSGWV